MKDPHISSGIETLRIRPRRGVRVLAMGLVLLGFCVFAWGLRYKLSLYQPPQSVARHMPAAKLLAGKKRVALPAIDLHTVAPDKTQPTGISLWVLAIFVPMSLRLWPGTRRWAQTFALAHFLPGSGWSSPSSVRPPPRLL